MDSATGSSRLVQRFSECADERAEIKSLRNIVYTTICTIIDLTEPFILLQSLYIVQLPCEKLSQRLDQMARDYHVAIVASRPASSLSNAGQRLGTTEADLQCDRVTIGLGKGGEVA